MEPKTVAEVLARIAAEYEKTATENAANKTALTTATGEMISQSKTIIMREREISELKKQRDENAATFTREIEGWKAKYARLEESGKTAFLKSEENAQQLIATIEEKLKLLNAATKELAEVRAKLATETARADALAQKYDPEIKAAAKAAAEAETKRQIAELEAKLKALKKE